MSTARPAPARLPLARVEVRPDLRAPDAWFWDVPAVGQLRREGLELAPATVLVGENGSGKSTLVEGVARAWQRSLTAAVEHWAPLPSPDESDLWGELELRGEHPRPQGGAFLRAEAMHGHFGSLDEGPAGVRAFGGPLNARSHGEGCSRCPVRWCTSSTAGASAGASGPTSTSSRTGGCSSTTRRGSCTTCSATGPLRAPPPARRSSG